MNLLSLLLLLGKWRDASSLTAKGDVGSDGGRVLFALLFCMRLQKVDSQAPLSLVNLTLQQIYNGEEDGASIYKNLVWNGEFDRHFFSFL